MMTPDKLQQRSPLLALAGRMSSIAVEPCVWGALLAGATQVGCSSPGSAPPPTPGAIHATLDDPTYLHLDSMDPAVIAAIKAGIDVGREQFGTFGPLRVYVMDGHEDNSELIEDFCRRSYRPSPGVSAEEQLAYSIEAFELPAEEGMIYSSIHHHSVEPFGAIVFINFDPPTQEGQIPHEARAAAIHEYVHIYQAAFQEPGGPDPRNPQQQIPGPAWLTEGPATYMSIASSDSPVWTERAHEQLESSFRQAASEHGVFLDDGQTYDELGDPELVHAVLYEGGSTAVRWLIERESHEAFWDGYYAAIPELGWEGAFERAFGMTLDSFYGAFRKHLRL